MKKLTKLLWLASLPSTDPAFTPLHRAERMCAEEEYPTLARAHHQAFLDASWGHSLDELDERAASLHQTALAQADRINWPEDAPAAHRDALEAQGYALGVTAVRVALREHGQDDMAAAS